MRCEWSDALQPAFELTKSLLVAASVFAVPCYDLQFKLTVDLSDTGVGAVLLQKDSDGVENRFLTF